MTEAWNYWLLACNIGQLECLGLTGRLREIVFTNVGAAQENAMANRSTRRPRIGNVCITPCCDPRRYQKERLLMNMSPTVIPEAVK